MGSGEFLNINFFTALFTLVNTIVLFVVLNMAYSQQMFIRTPKLKIQPMQIVVTMVTPAIPTAKIVV